MAEALLKGILGAQLFAAKHITVTDVRSDRLDFLEKTYHVRTSLNNTLAADSADIVLLAIKPQTMAAVLQDIGEVIKPQTLLISIAAGIPLSVLQYKPQWKAVRAMPNTPALVGSGMAALAAGKMISPEDKTVAEALFNAVGRTVWVEEGQLDAVTALSGSGPAFVYRLIDHMARCGTDLGLAPDIARQLTVQTFIGAARMVMETGETPEELVRKVSSPNGTTVAGLAVLDKSSIKEILLQTLETAKQRSRELAEGK